MVEQPWSASAPCWASTLQTFPFLSPTDEKRITAFKADTNLSVTNLNTLSSTPALFHGSSWSTCCENLALIHSKGRLCVPKKGETSWIHTLRNPLTPKNDWHLIYPYNITLESNIKVMRIRKWSRTHGDLDFMTNSHCQLFGYISRTVWRICELM